MLALKRIAEQKIQEAIKEGKFEDLPLKGKPLPFNTEPAMPHSVRSAYKILKKAGILPEELQLRKEIHLLEELLCACNLEEEKQNFRQQLNKKQLRYDLLMEKRRSRSCRNYRGKIMRRLG